MNVPDLYALLQRVHGTFEQVAAITEKESNEYLPPTSSAPSDGQSVERAALMFLA